jgi:protein-tyrosine-phosphatase
MEASSAGSRPSGQVNTRAVAFMKEKGIDIGIQASKGLSDVPAIQWDYVITMGCGDACPALAATHRIDWNLPDPKLLSDDGFREVRNEIEIRVRELVDRMSRKGEAMTIG